MKEEKQKKNNENKQRKTEAKVDYKDKALRQAQGKAEEYLDGWKRCLADFDNYKKQQVRTFEELRKYASEGIVQEIIPVLDSFELALKNIPNTSEAKDWKQGIIYVRGQLEDILRSRGLEVINVVGEKFNPEFHEAIESAESEKESGTILEELQKGYILYGKVLRPARVKVAK